MLTDTKKIQELIIKFFKHLWMIFYYFVVEGKSLKNGHLGISGICYFSLKDNTFFSSLAKYFSWSYWDFFEI